jgi:mRNA interferase MazF
MRRGQFVTVATQGLSQIAIDKITVVPNAKIGGVIGSADSALMTRVNRALALFLGLV